MLPTWLEASLYDRSGVKEGVPPRCCHHHLYPQSGLTVLSSIPGKKSSETSIWAGRHRDCCLKVRVSKAFCVLNMEELFEATHVFVC